MLPTCKPGRLPLAPSLKVHFPIPSLKPPEPPVPLYLESKNLLRRNYQLDADLQKGRIKRRKIYGFPLNNLSLMCSAAATNTRHLVAYHYLTLSKGTKLAIIGAYSNLLAKI
jgi:hypothetical protein